jgi:tight adherence protein C
MLLLVVALLALAAAAFLVSELVTLPAQERDGSLRRAAHYGRAAEPRTLLGDESLRDRAFLPLKEKLARLVLRMNPKWTIEQVSLRLLSAGLGRRVSPTGFLATKGMFLIGGVVFGFIVGGSVGGGLSAFMFVLALAGAGFIGPDFYINARIKSRREKIRAQLPDALDLLAVSVEAGLGFDGALQKLTEEMEGPLIEEFTLTLGEMRIGETRQDALKKFSERVGAPEVSAFVRSIIQADQFGISLGRILKVQAADTRLRRQQAAEEKAMKAPIKMLFPTVMFIFPAMFLVILGPAFLNLVKVI